MVHIEDEPLDASIVEKNGFIGEISVLLRPQYGGFSLVRMKCICVGETD